MQYTVNRTLKGRLLQAERRHIGNALAANGLQGRRKHPRKKRPKGAQWLRLRHEKGAQTKCLRAFTDI